MYLGVFFLFVLGFSLVPVCCVGCGVRCSYFAGLVGWGWFWWVVFRVGMVGLYLWSVCCLLLWCSTWFVWDVVYFVRVWSCV